MAKERTVEDIRAEIAETRRNLKSSVFGFRESIEPKNVVKNSVDEVKQFAKTEFDGAKAQFVETDGSLRTKRVLAVAGAVVGLVAFAITVNVIAGKRQVRPPKGRKALTAK